MFICLIVNLLLRAPPPSQRIRREPRPQNAKRSRIILRHFVHLSANLRYCDGHRLWSAFGFVKWRRLLQDDALAARRLALLCIDGLMLNMHFCNDAWTTDTPVQLPLLVNTTAGAEQNVGAVFRAACG